MSQAARQLTVLRRAQRVALHAQRVKNAQRKADRSCCYRCLKQPEYVYPMQLPGYMFPYDEPDTGAPTGIQVCADCLRSACDRLATWVLNP